MQKSQRGVSYSTFLLVLIILSIVLKVVVTIWPAYWDDYVINKQIRSVLDDNPSLTSDKFNSAMEERLSMNNIDSLKIEDIAKVSNDGGQLHVAKRYEVRNHFLLNIDLVLSFEKDFDQRTVQAK